MRFLNKIFGIDSKVKEYLENGAAVIDVRSINEFRAGHVEGSVNIPLDQVEAETEQIRSMDKPLVLCCASGARSGKAAGILRSQGIDCLNGGSWMSVQSALKK